MKNKEQWESEKIDIGTTYDKLKFNVSFKMSYKDSKKNPNIGIIISDKNDKYLDYFYIKGDEYKAAFDKTNKEHSFSIGRVIPNKAGLFDKGNKITFYIEESKKVISVKDFNTSIEGFR